MQRCTKEQWQAIGLYIREMADLVGLRDWFITVHDQTPGDPTSFEANAMMAVRSTWGRKRADVALNRQWFTYSPEEVRHSVLHELIHIHQEQLDSLVHAIEPVLGVQAWTMFYHNFKLGSEYLADALSDGLAKSFQLPEIPPGCDDCSILDPGATGGMDDGAEGGGIVKSGPAQQGETAPAGKRRGKGS